MNPNNPAINKLPSPQWREVTGRKEHGWSSSLRAYRYGESLIEPHEDDLYIVEGVEEEAPWGLYGKTSEPIQYLDIQGSMMLFQRQHIAMEQAQRVYWGKIYEQVVGYNANEDDPMRTSLDMITTISSVLGHMEAQEEARSYFAT